MEVQQWLWARRGRAGGRTRPGGWQGRAKPLLAALGASRARPLSRAPLPQPPPGLHHSPSLPAPDRLQIDSRNTSDRLHIHSGTPSHPCSQPSPPPAMHPQRKTCPLAQGTCPTVPLPKAWAARAPTPRPGLLPPQAGLGQFPCLPCGSLLSLQSVGTWNPAGGGWHRAPAGPCPAVSAPHRVTREAGGRRVGEAAPGLPALETLLFLTRALRWQLLCNSGEAVK